MVVHLAPSWHKTRLAPWRQLPWCKLGLPLQLHLLAVLVQPQVQAGHATAHLLCACIALRESVLPRIRRGLCTGRAAANRGQQGLGSKNGSALPVPTQSCGRGPPASSYLQQPPGCPLMGPGRPCGWLCCVAETGLQSLMHLSCGQIRGSGMLAQRWYMMLAHLSPALPAGAKAACPSLSCLASCPPLPSQWHCLHSPAHRVQSSESYSQRELQPRQDKTTTAAQACVPVPTLSCPPACSWARGSSRQPGRDGGGPTQQPEASCAWPPPS